MNNSKIKEIINEWDPISLIRSGTPNDEYDYEINQIAKSINDRITIENLAKNIYKVFSDSFGNDIFNKDFKECFEVAIKYFKMSND